MHLQNVNMQKLPLAVSFCLICAAVRHSSSYRLIAPCFHKNRCQLLEVCFSLAATCAVPPNKQSDCRIYLSFSFMSLQSAFRHLHEEVK